MAEPMTNADNFWLCMDDPTNLMVITGFMEFEELLDFQRLLSTIETRLTSFPRFRKRVVRPAFGVGVPYWHTDNNFDIRYHVQRVALPPPGDKNELQEMISSLMTTPLDPSKPLWQVHMIENYGKGCVVLYRIHHCIADGIALVYVLLSAADKTPDAPWSERQRKDKKEDSSFGDIWPFGAIIKNIQKVTDTTQQVRERIAEELKETISDPSNLIRLAKAGPQLTADIASVIAKLTVMPSDPETAFKGKLGVRKSVVWTEPMPLDKIKTIGRSIRTATLNDVLITTVTGAMRRYLKARNYPVNELDLRVTVPVNIRKPGTEFELGNKFSLVFLALPVYIEDPVLRLKEVKRRMDHLKKAPDAMVSFGVLSAVGLLPPNIARKAAHFFGDKASAVMTNVPGPRQPLYFAGKKISNMMFWVPRSGNVGLGISIFSYNGKVTMGIAADEGLMPDPEVLLEGFEEESDYLLDLVTSGKIYDEPLVLHDRYKESRCKALTKSGGKCKKRALPGSEYCKVHQVYTEEDSRVERDEEFRVEDEEESDRVADVGTSRCKEVTRSGRQCKRRAMPGSPYCKLHQPKAEEKDTQDIAQILKDLSGQ
jgi:diacylglycerol O-acyltransferase